MPKKDYDKIHRTNMDVYARKIQAVYNSAVKEAAAIGATVPNFDPSKPFSFSDYPITHDRVKKLSKELQSNLETVVLNGIDHEWTLSNNKNNELCNRVFGDNVGKLTKEQYRRYYSNNSKAADAFKARKVAGLNLSDRVWNYTNQFKTEIEFGLDLDLRDGTSATDMARNLKQYLQNPDKLFRRVRNEHGQLHLSKAAKAFKPGQGMYRSSVKNAQRLARTETNMAYHAADHERWQQFDFVVGVEVRRSNNLSCHCPLCDSLAGKYPKDFKFTSWHPQCRCSAVPVLKTIEELKGDTERIINGEPTNTDSVNTVNQMPDSFTSWIEENKERFGATNTPYFIRDNFKDGKIAQGLSFATGIDKQVVNNIIVPKSLSTQERADIRHQNRTEEQINDIQSRWDERNEIAKQDKFGDINIATELSKLENYDFKDFIWYLAEDKELKLSISELTTINRKEAIEKLRKFWSNKGDDEYANMSRAHFWIAQKQSKITDAQYRQIRQSSDGYIRSNNSFKINYCLRSGNMNILTADDLKTIRELKTVIKDNVIPENTLLYRRVASDWVKDVLEFDPKKLSGNNVLTKLNQSRRDITTKGFTSTSAILKDNLFDHRAFLLEIKVKKGTSAYITNNMKESEVVLNMGQKIRFVKAERLSNGDYKLYCEAW